MTASAGWLPPAAESGAFEGLRRGEVDAFLAVAQPLQPALRRLAGLTVGSAEAADALVARTWAIGLGGLDMFCWHTPFATWIAGITVTQGRARAPGRGRPPRQRVIPPTPRRAPGPPDWSDLPWSARWAQAAPTLAAVLAALPLPQREVVHTHDVEQWPTRRVCDVLGLPEAVFERLLAEGRAQLRDALAALVGDTDGGPHREAQITAVTRTLHRPATSDDEPLDPRVLAVFGDWRARQLTRWQRIGLRLSSTPRAARC